MRGLRCNSMWLSSMGSHLVLGHLSSCKSTLHYLLCPLWLLCTSLLDWLWSGWEAEQLVVEKVFGIRSSIAYPSAPGTEFGCWLTLHVLRILGVCHVMLSRLFISQGFGLQLTGIHILPFLSYFSSVLVLLGLSSQGFLGCCRVTSFSNCLSLLRNCVSSGVYHALYYLQPGLTSETILL